MNTKRKLPRTGTIAIIVVLFSLQLFVNVSGSYAYGYRGNNKTVNYHHTQGTVSPDEIIARVKTWVDANPQVPYDEGGWYQGYREDCSGFVSMAWGLPQPGLTTYTLPTVSHQIRKDDLQPGDILLNQWGGWTMPGSPDAHVVIFDSWVDSSHTNYNAYEENPYWNGAHYTTNIPYPFWPGYDTSDYVPMRLNSLSNSTTPTPPITPTSSQTVLYSADWSSGLNGWTGSQEWSVSNGQLQSDGTDGNGHFGLDAISPPYRPSTANYAVEARIQVVNSVYGLGQCYVGIRGRVQNPSTSPSYVGDGYFLGFNGGYNAAMVAFESLNNAPNGGFDALQSQNFTPGFEWHTYRVEFRGNQMTLFIDGKLIAQVTDSRLPTTGILQLEDGFCPANVSSFQVFTL